MRAAQAAYKQELADIQGLPDAPALARSATGRYLATVARLQYADVRPGAYARMEAMLASPVPTLK